MATSELNILIKLKDEATSAIGNVRKSLQGMEDSFKTLSVIGGAALGAVTLVGTQAVKDAQEAIQTQNQLQAVLKSTGGVAGVTADQVNTLADSLSKTTNFGDDAIVSAQNLLLTFTKVGKDVFPQATKTILDMSTALGQDLKASSIQLGKALNDPIEGVNALRRVGVSFSNEQQEVIKTLVETGKVAEAQKFILAELATEFGGSAQAVADPLTMLKNRISEISEEIGKALLPQINSLVEKIKPVVENIIEWINANPKLAANILIATGAVGGFLLVVGGLGLLLPGIIAGISALLSPVGLVAIAIAGLVAGFIIFKDRLGEIFTELDQKTGLVTLLKDAWQGVVDTYNNFLKPALEKLWASLQPFKPFLDALGKVFGTILVVAISGFSMALSGLIQLLSILLSVFVRVQTFINETLLKVFNAIQSAVMAVVNAVEQLINAFSRLGAVKSLGNFVGNVVGGAKGLLGLADGGIVTKPTVAMIGEGGEPEAVIPLSKLGSVGAGGGVTINFTGTFGQGVADEIGDMIINKLQLNMKV